MQADVGIAVGTGTDVMVESAGVVLVRSDVRDVFTLIRLSGAAHKAVRRNLGLAIASVVVALPLAAGVAGGFGSLLSSWGGAVLVGVSLAALVLNARLLRQTAL